MYCIDIETLSTPEVSGYGIVIPNFAIVKVPEKITDTLEWMYVQIPIQEQLDNGLVLSASGMKFWNDCKTNFPYAYNEMFKSFSLDVPVVTIDTKKFECTNIPNAIRDFMNNKNMNADVQIYGNGCHFDCSILQENCRVQFGDGNLWHFRSPQNYRTLKNLIPDEVYSSVKLIIDPVLDNFKDLVLNRTEISKLQLHNPLYDAASEALMIRCMLEYLQK